jgi:hypothetical protein
MNIKTVAQRANDGLIEVFSCRQEGTHSVVGSEIAMQRIFDSGARPTAVFASNDLPAVGAMGAILGRGLSILQDISIIGFSDIQLSAVTCRHSRLHCRAWRAQSCLSRPVSLPQRPLETSASKSIGSSRLGSSQGDRSHFVCLQLRFPLHQPLEDHHASSHLHIS